MASLAREASEASERPGRGFGQFRGLANGTLERLKKMSMPWPDWLPMPNGVAFCELWHREGLANSTVERPEEQNAVASLAREASERPGRGFGQFRRLANGTLERLKKMGVPWPDWLPL